MSIRAQDYQHWKGTSTSIWRRRWTITSYGLRLCWRSKLLRGIFAIAWVCALAVVAFHFLVGQLLSTDSTLASFVASTFGRKAKAILDGVTAWILLYPEITVDGLFRITLFSVTTLYGTLCCLAVALFVPKLISQDLSSRAVLIYNSKALTRTDYLAGKFGIVFVLLGGIMIAPLAFVWFASNVLSPDWSFFWHGFPALLRAMAAGVVTVVSLSAFALAVSSLVRKSGAATALWIVLWLVSGFVAEAASHVFPWGQCLSPINCLREVTRGLYDLKGVLDNAKESLPFFESMLKALPAKTASAVETMPGGSWMPILFLAGFLGVSILAINKRISNE